MYKTELKDTCSLKWCLSHVQDHWYIVLRFYIKSMLVLTHKFQIVDRKWNAVLHQQGQFLQQYRKWNTNFKAFICREQSETLSTNKGRFCNNSEINTIISKRSSVEKKAKLFQLTRADFVTIAKLILLFQSDHL